MDIGTWEVEFDPGIPPESVDYCLHAVCAAWDGYRRLPMLDSGCLAGPVRFEPKTETAAGWYRKRDDQATIMVDLGPQTAGGARPWGVYGADPATSRMALAVAHEVAHRIWFRHMGARARAMWALASSHPEGPSESWGDALGLIVVGAPMEPRVARCLAYARPGAGLTIDDDADEAVLGAGRLAGLQERRWARPGDAPAVARARARVVELGGE